MTPYTKKIVELHKIHKAIEEKDCNGGGNTPSGDITIDNVVKFIHDNPPTFVSEFPYTKYDDIPKFPNDYEYNKKYIVKGTSEEINELYNIYSDINIEFILNTENYNIVDAKITPIG